MVVKIFTFLSMTFATLAVLWVGGLLWFATNVSFAKPDQVNKPVDAIIVLTGGTKRIQAGIDLLKSSDTSDLFISGVNPEVTQKDLLNGKNADLCCVTLGYTATNTRENAEEVKLWTQTKDIKNIRLVTSNYHIIRAMLEFKKTMPEIEIFAHPVAPEQFNLFDKKFWPITFSEYNKTLLIWLQFNQAKAVSA